MYRVTIYFYILKRRKDVNGACPIYCRISFKKERASFSIGLKTKPKKSKTDTNDMGEYVDFEEVDE